MCFGCLFAIFAAAFPRLALLFVWLFSSPNLVMRAFHDILIWPILGIIFLPFTTLIYVLVYNPAVGLTGWGWFLVVLGFLIDIGAFSGSAYSNRNRMPRYGRE
jgi:hypothetical protein